MDQRANGNARTHRPGADIIIEHLARFAARISGPYETRVISTGQIPYLHVASQIDPDLFEDVLCDLSTDLPDYLTGGASGWVPSVARTRGGRSHPSLARGRYRQHVTSGCTRLTIVAMGRLRRPSLGATARRGSWATAGGYRSAAAGN
jgi:hypothetical protein